MKTAKRLVQGFPIVCHAFSVFVHHFSYFPYVFRVLATVPFIFNYCSNIFLLSLERSVLLYLLRLLCLLYLLYLLEGKQVTLANNCSSEA